MKTSPFSRYFLLLNLFLLTAIVSAPAQSLSIIPSSLRPPPSLVTLPINATNQGSFTIIPWAPITPVTSSNSIPPQGSNCVTAPAGLVGWWKGDGNALDSANGNNGINQNIAYTNGVVDQAFAFDPENFTFGTYTGIQIADQPAYDLTNSLTIEGWIRPRGDSYIIFWRGDNRPGLDPYYLSMQGNHTLRFGICDANNNTAFVDTALNYSIWTHVAATLNGSSGTLSIYTNGILASQTNTTIRPFGNLLPDQSPGIGIGNVNDGGNNFPFIGDIDEISLYNRSLSLAEIQSIYNADSAGKCSAATSTNDCVTPPTGLIGWWKGDGNANDSLGNLNGIWLNNADYAVGEVGEGFHFSGSSQQQSLDIPYAPSLVQTNYSVEAWIDPQSEPDNEINQDWIFGQCYGAAQLVVRTGATGVYVVFQFGSGGAYGPFNAVVSTGEIPLNQFTHVAGTWDGVTLKLYINGVLNNSSVAGAVPLDTGCDYFIGGVYHEASDACDYVGQFFTGIIDEVSFYNRALSAQEIQGIYNAGSTGKCPPIMTSKNNCVAPPSGLTSWWKGDGNMSDSAGNNNGTITEGSISYQPAEVGHGFYFDGGANRIVVPDAPSLNFGAGQNFSIEGWISPLLPPPNLDFGVMTIVDKREAPNISQCLGYEFSLVNGQLNVRLSDSISGLGQNWVGGPDLRDGKMHHVALTVERNSTVGGNLYVDGVNVLQFDPTSQSGDLSNTEPLHIGNHPDPELNCFFKGRIDEISIYNRALASNEIAAIYKAGNAGKCTSILDAPKIFNISPAVATNGAMVMISGNNFNPNGADDIVYFGAVQANVLSATTTNLIVRVPAGATYAPVTVTVDGLTAYSSQNFEPTFVGDGSGLDNSSFGSRLDLPTGSGPCKVVIADVDGDGKPDLIVANNYGNSISLYRNISAGGLLTANSFAPRVDIATLAGQYSPFGLAVADVDGDGKLDIIVSDYEAGMVSVYRNTCTPGNLTSNAFATRVDFACGPQPQGIEVKDVDGDGRPEILTANTGDGTISILRNTSVVGSLDANSFAPQVDVKIANSCDSVVVGDLDGDGKPDIAVANATDGTVSVLRNIGSPGEITTNSFAPRMDIAISDYVIQLTLGDLDGDGKLDLIVASYLSQKVSVLYNTSALGEISFASPVDFGLGGRGHSPALADLNGDGKPDLMVATELNSLLSVFQNNSSPGSFTAESLSPRIDFGTGWNAYSATAADLDGDGRPDLVFVSSYDNTLSIYQNQMPTQSGNTPNPPVITSQPMNQTTLAGAGATFSVTATGRGTLTYQWRFNGNNIGGANQPTLTMTNLHSYQAGNYSVRISNAGGAVISSNAMLTVTTQTILIYNYSGSENVTATRQEFSYKYSGQMFFIPSSTNGVFVGWANINNKRQYWISPFSDYQVITIPGVGTHIYTVMGKAGNDADASGSYIWSYLHKGLNATLSVGGNRSVSFPGIFTCNDSHIYPDPQTGSMILREANSTYSYAGSATQTANNTGQTVADLVNVLTQSLARQGYSKQ